MWRKLHGLALLLAGPALAEPALPPGLERAIIAWEQARTAPVLAACDETPDARLAGELAKRAQTAGALRARLPAGDPQRLTIGQRNSRFLRALFETWGFPDRCLVGDAGARAAVALVMDSPYAAVRQHGAALAEGAVKAGRLDPALLPELADRVALEVRGQQRFGTQTRCDPGTGRHVALPVEDADGLDARREAHGLMPMTLYLALLDARAPCPGQMGPGA